MFFSEVSLNGTTTSLQPPKRMETAQPKKITFFFWWISTCQQLSNDMKVVLIRVDSERRSKICVFFGLENMIHIMKKIWFIWILLYNYRRKFRSETSDNMDSWKAEVGRVRREKIRRKKMQVREKVGKSRNTVFFQWFVAPEGRKVGSLKRRVRSQLARWEMKNCTPLWREAHLQVKKRSGPLLYKTHHCRTTFGSWDVEKVHAVVARSTFPSQNVQSTPLSDHFWKLRCRKSARRWLT